MLDFISISMKALVSAPPRLQRLLLRLLNYNATLQWIPGKEMIFTDHLSRNISSKESNEPTCSGLDMKIEDVYLNVSEDRCFSLAAETDQGETLIALKNLIVKGWPERRDECPQDLRKLLELSEISSVFLDSLSIEGY